MTVCLANRLPPKTASISALTATGYQYIESGRLKTSTAAKKAARIIAVMRWAVVCGMAARISHRTHMAAASQKNAPFPLP